MKIEVTDEIATRNEPATICMYEGNELVQVIVCEIKQEAGADGGSYSVAKITSVQNIG